MAGRPTFVFHDLAQARAALAAAAEANRPIALITARAAACYGGPALYLEIFRQVGGNANAALILDCGDDAAVAVEALAAGAPAVVLRGSRTAYARVKQIAEAYGARLTNRRPVAYDLLQTADPHAFCRALLAGH